MQSLQIKVTAQQDLTETNQVINGSLYSIFIPLKGLSYEIDFENVDEN
jgi:hypothetical protein